VTDTSNKPVRTRFAPSPTGSLHVGGLRTVLWSWLFARHHGGQFILRIEDTDQKRYDPNALQSLYRALHWSGVDWDEGPDKGGPHGPYVQSERLDKYQHWARWLVENDYAYYCYCSSERLEQVNKEKQARKEPSGYDRRCRFISDDEAAQLAAQCEAEGRKPVIRLKMPLEGQTTINDLIRGEVTFENEQQQDAVLLKSDGFPTYHLAVVIDDHDMQISHVTRGIEWLPSVPLHMQLWKAFGWEPPAYAHMPVMLNPDGKGKLSKRKPPLDKYGNSIPVMVEDYIEAGYLPEAVDNFLVGVGWNFGDEREVFSLEEARERFVDFSRINPANAAFPIDKLEWINGVYIREKLTVEELAERLRPVLEDAGYTVDSDLLLQVTPLVQIRIKTLTDVVSLAGFFFSSDFKQVSADDVIQKKMDAASTREMLDKAYAVLQAMSEAEWNTDTMYARMDALATEIDVKRGQLFGALRVAVTGQMVSTPTFETMEILGKDESLRRISLAMDSLTQTV
jgi:glutamyl-tRNA synthetase